MKYQKLLFIILLSLIFGIFQAYDLDHFTFNQIIASTVIPLLVIIPISFLTELIYFLKSKEFSYEKFQERIWKIASILFLIIFISYSINALHTQLVK